MPWWRCLPLGSRGSTSQTPATTNSATSQTNCAWFKPKPQSTLHFAHTALCATATPDLTRQGPVAPNPVSILQHGVRMSLGRRCGKDT